MNKMLEAAAVRLCWLTVIVLFAVQVLSGILVAQVCRQLQSARRWKPWLTPMERRYICTDCMILTIVQGGENNALATIGRGSAGKFDAIKLTLLPSLVRRFTPGRSTAATVCHTVRLPALHTCTFLLQSSPISSRVQSASGSPAAPRKQPNCRPVV